MCAVMMSTEFYSFFLCFYLVPFVSFEDVGQNSEGIILHEQLLNKGMFTTNVLLHLVRIMLTS